jgi:hypothetical protein
MQLSPVVKTNQNAMAVGVLIGFGLVAAAGRAGKPAISLFLATQRF